MTRLVIATTEPRVVAEGRVVNLVLTYKDGDKERTLFISHHEVEPEEALRMAADAPLAFTFREDGSPNPLRAMQRELGNVCASELIPDIIKLVEADLQ